MLIATGFHPSHPICLYQTTLPSQNPLNLTHISQWFFTEKVTSSSVSTNHPIGADDFAGLFIR